MDGGVIAVVVFGLVQLAIWGGAAYFLIRKIWWRNALAALRNPAEAQFTRVQSASEESVFQVTPARPSRAGLMLIVTGLAILLIFTLLLPAAILAALGLIPLIMGIITFSIGSRYRAAATIAVSDQALRAGQREWPFADIAAVNTYQGSSINTDDPAPGTYRDVSGRMIQRNQSTTVMFSKAFNRRAVERSHILTLRCHGESQEAVLCGGLTRPCADVLLNDLSAEIARRTCQTDQQRGGS